MSHVTSLDWSREDGSYMFHVVYDSDTDEEDMGLWDVEQYRENPLFKLQITIK